MGDPIKLFQKFCIIIICSVAVLSACKGGQKGSDSKAPAPPVAEAKQAVAAPVLAPPPPSVSPPAPPAPAETPKGPVTILPSVEAPGGPLQGTPPTPPPQAPAQVPPAVVPQAPDQTQPTAFPPAPQVVPPAVVPEAPAASATGTITDVMQTPPTLPEPPPVAPVAPVQPQLPVQAPQQAQPPAQAPVISGLAQPMQEAPAVPPASPVAAIAAPEMPTAAEPAAAAPTAPEPVRADQKLIKASTDIEVILDASGSMAAPFGAMTTSKIDLMKQAFSDIVSEMAASQKDFPRNLSVRVFGSKSMPDEGNRDDTDLIVAMGAPDTQIVRDSLATITPKGLSPISKAILLAPKDFPAGSAADRLIVLVADGADNTEEDPCAATAKIKLEPAKVQINVVAFDVNAEDQAKLECIAQNGDGKFFLARNDSELRAALDQAINSTAPYNLKLVVQAAATPIPFDFTVLKAGTQEKIKQDSGFGTKLLNLHPASYDIMVEYSSSPESRKPSKILKGIDVLAGSKVEQTITFDLGGLTLSALDNAGNPAGAKFEIAKADQPGAVAELTTGPETKMVFVTPGIYDISAELLESQIEEFTIAEKGVDVKLGETSDHAFRFQKGSLSIKGETTQKQALSFVFQIYRAGRPDVLVGSGAFPVEGGSVLVAPGTYELIVIGMDPKMMVSPRTKISDVEIKAAETAEIAATFEMGTMKLSAIDGQNNKLSAEFVIRDHDSQMEIADISSENGEPISVAIPPGNYDIVASSLKSILNPKPAVPVTGVVVTVDKPAEQVIKFVLGTLRLRGRGVKEQSIQTQFSLYKSGTDEIVSTAPVSGDWMIFDVAPGMYDALATNMTSQEKPQPMIWLRDLKVEDGKSTSHEAIFTAGKLKIIGRGPNNKLITCNFKIFQYGSDRELINGATGDDWEVFEIQPGKYYLEAAYHDDDASVMLKKWINISVGENEIVEEVLRF